MSQKNFILIFVNVCYLAVHFVAFHGQGIIIELWIRELFAAPALSNIFSVLLYLSILTVSFLSAKDKMTQKVQAYLFTTLLLAGLTINIAFQISNAPEYVVSQILSVLPVSGCILYLLINPSKILNTNQAKLIKTDHD